MGHKGDNKLKPKKSKSLPHENLNLSSITRSGSNSVQALVKNNDSGKGGGGMTLKLNLFFIAMDILTLMAYPIVFIYGMVCRFLKSQESTVVSIKMAALTSAA